MKYKVGDKVRIVSERTWNMNYNMFKYLGTVMTIDTVYDDCYGMIEDGGKILFHKSMIVGLEEEEFVKGEMVIDENGDEVEFIFDAGVPAVDGERYLVKTKSFYYMVRSITKKKEVEEMTLEQVCKELGRTIKIIK